MKTRIIELESGRLVSMKVLDDGRAVIALRSALGMDIGFTLSQAAIEALVKLYQDRDYGLPEREWPSKDGKPSYTICKILQFTLTDGSVEADVED
jgi:hypothetical protein